MLQNLLAHTADLLAHVVKHQHPGAMVYGATREESLHMQVSSLHKRLSSSTPALQCSVLLRHTATGWGLPKMAYSYTIE